MDLLHEDLSHLTGESMVFSSNGDRSGGKRKKGADLVSIEYLLDIIRSLNEWISSRLESNHQEDNTLDRSMQTPVFSQKQQHELASLPLPLPAVSNSAPTAKSENLIDKRQYNIHKSLDLTEKVK